MILFIIIWDIHQLSLKIPERKEHFNHANLWNIFLLSFSVTQSYFDISGLEWHPEGKETVCAAGCNIQTWQRRGWDYGHFFQERISHWQSPGTDNLLSKTYVRWGGGGLPPTFNSNFKKKKSVDIFFEGWFIFGEWWYPLSINLPSPYEGLLCKGKPYKLNGSMILVQIDRETSWYFL